VSPGSDTAADWLARLAALWRAERAAVRERFVAARAEAPLAERVRRGLALSDLVVIDEAAAARDRVRIQLRVPDSIDLDDTRLGPGDPVVLWTTRPDGPDAIRGVMGWRDGQAVWVTLDRWPDMEPMVLHLDAEAPEITFDRGDHAIEAFAAARAGSQRAYLRAVLGGERAPIVRPVPTFTPRDAGLDELQRRAVGLTLAAADVALIHGPPGTGKTRTLVEAIAQRVGAGERVLATAPSNTAVDNLGERLAAIGLPVVRLGHPARVAPALTALTLDAQVDADDASELAREWRDRARALRKSASRGGGREQWAEARALDRDAAGELARAEARILARARVVLATCAGADHPALRDQDFDAVVLDEATQAPDPLALCALARGKVAVLAGDPRQLGPTVIGDPRRAEGLASTLFERLLPAHPHAGVMLRQQHRMHRAIMEFPSRSMYDGALVAAPEVADHTLADLGVADDSLRPLPLWLIDTAGKDWTEIRGFLRQTEPTGAAGKDRAPQWAVGSTAPGLPAFALRDGKLSPGEDPSTLNPGHARRVADEVRRLLSRGLAPDRVAVIAAYHAQVRRLRELLAPERAAGLEIGTVDGFQGREKDAVIVDTVRSNETGDIGFLGDTRRMNVALTRARRFLLVVADSATLGGHPYYSALIGYTDELGAHGSAWSDDADPIDPPAAIDPG
jgi:superfamily I DNA and/or RNA helicase